MQGIGANRRRRIIVELCFFFLLVALIIIDQITKYYFSHTLNLYQVKPVIKDFFYFSYTINTGAAWSFLADVSWAQTFFKILTIVLLLAVLGWVVYLIIKKKKPSKWLAVAVSLCFGGAVGNLVDRFAFNRVRDFIFAFYNTNIFPAIFNVADIALVVGVIMVCVYLLFLDNDAIFKKKQVEDNLKEEENGK